MKIVKLCFYYDYLKTDLLGSNATGKSFERRGRNMRFPLKNGTNKSRLFNHTLLTIAPIMSSKVPKVLCINPSWDFSCSKM